MAIVKCRECGEEVSNKAEKCPHCGVKTPHSTNYELLSNLVYDHQAALLSD